LKKYPKRLFLFFFTQKKQYDKYFLSNAVEKGGSFYLQSKIYRAKEQLDEFIREKKKEQ
jgi:import inner membrane translocase subunit TIM16